MIPFLDTYWPFIYIASGLFSIAIQRMTQGESGQEDGPCPYALTFVFGVFVLPIQLAMIVYRSAIQVGDNARKELGDDHFLTK